MPSRLSKLLPAYFVWSLCPVERNLRSLQLLVVQMTTSHTCGFSATVYLGSALQTLLMPTGDIHHKRSCAGLHECMNCILLTTVLYAQMVYLDKMWLVTWAV